MGRNAALLRAGDALYPDGKPHHLEPPGCLARTDSRYRRSLRRNRRLPVGGGLAQTTARLAVGLDRARGDSGDCLFACDPSAMARFRTVGHRNTDRHRALAQWLAACLRGIGCAALGAHYAVMKK